jgi:threonine dehydratase
VPVGMGSGICSVIAVRDLLGLRTEVIGVVSRSANAIALSFAAGKPIATNAAHTFADGIAVRVVNPDAFAIIKKGAARILEVTDDEIAAAMRFLYRSCHTLTEGAGAAATAALMKEKDVMQGRRVGVIVTGGNIDMPAFATVLSGRTPPP